MRAMIKRRQKQHSTKGRYEATQKSRLRLAAIRLFLIMIVAFEAAIFLM
jgi:hypothetical protein